MTELDFDVIVIGGGIAGTVCALRLAQFGHEVALVERGEAPGTKNLSGGVFYCDIMNEVIPDFANVAPIERVILRNHLSFLTETGHISLDVADSRLVEAGNAVSVLRVRLDAWLAEQAEAAGVAVVPGMHVDRLLTTGGVVTGVAVGEDELRCKVVVAADGITSFAARSIGLRPQPANNHVALGVKSVIELGEDVVRSRFGLGEREGAAWAMVGEATRGLPGGGFLYTNRSSVSIGVVMRLDALLSSRQASSDVHDAFLTHPSVAPLIDGGELVQYGCHLTAEAGALEGPIHTDGFVVIGDAAGLTLNTGFAIRGMDLAAGSALVAADAISQALRANDYASGGLERYPTMLAASTVGADVATYKNAPDALAEDALYREIGPLLGTIFHDIYRHDDTPHRHAWQIAKDAVVASPVKLRDLARVAWKGGRSL
ncbi:FAD-dependent oxidoreductase [Nanchangia anserum]|uniref:FAD-dependent oxidoreductase n=1 Tax=Nanchangia anserum TaxID=2692125 RepID=A0A8I0GAI4_9ACTO|nr:FAD-dependent oxidoreductase [Nanchangia anserum]MBD3689233.1 FAD-dependent oxidoreductase [Nanchangia anserum]QOX81455.1 FAD-dependent oxidoreductase [Nanchangia anserum]